MNKFFVSIIGVIAAIGSSCCGDNAKVVEKPTDKLNKKYLVRQFDTGSDKIILEDVFAHVWINSGVVFLYREDSDWSASRYNLAICGGAIQIIATNILTMAERE